MPKSSVAPKYDLVILSREKRVFEGTAKTLTAPGEMGYLQILANHAPIIALLKPGILSFVDGENAKHTYKISGGILEVVGGKATLLVDAPMPSG